MATSTITPLKPNEPTDPTDAGTKGLLQNLSNEATKSRDQVIQEQLSGIDQNKSFAPDKATTDRHAAEAGGAPNDALAEALGRKKQKIYGQGLEQLKAQAAFDSSGRQLTAQQKASAALQQNQQIRYRQAANDYKVALNKKKQENGILMSAIQFGTSVIGGVIGGVASGGNPQMIQMGAQAGNQVGGAAGGLAAGGHEEESLQ